MNASKILLSAATLVLIAATPAFATSTTSENIDTPTAPAPEMAAPSEAPAPDMAAPSEAPATDMAPAPDMAAPATTAPAMEAAPPAATDTTTAAPAADDTTAPPATMDATAPTPETTTAETPAVEPVVEAPKPVKKKTAPAKLSALAKKYDLMSLDTDSNKSLSRNEFTANGFSNAKTFGRYDRDGNGKLTNSEINAYASTIESNSDK